MKTLTLKHMLAATLLAVVSSGCGFFVQMTTKPAPSGNAVFDIKVTNASQCPAAPPGVAVLPFFSTSQIPSLPPPVASGIDAFLSAACTSTVPGNLPGGIDCQIFGRNLVCTFTAPDQTLPDPDAQPTTFGVGGTEVVCEHVGGDMKCTLPLDSLPQAPGYQGGPAEDVIPLCFSAPTGATLCLAPVETTATLPAGGMATTRFFLPKPPGSPNQSYVFPIPLSSGVCKPGTPNAGEPCGNIINTIDCGNVMSSDCGSGVCQGGTNDTLGCDNDAGCPGGGACAQCFPSFPDEFVLSFACANFRPTPAPTLSPWGLALAAGLLLAAGAVGLRWRTRRA